MRLIKFSFHFVREGIGSASVHLYTRGGGGGEGARAPAHVKPAHLKCIKGVYQEFCNNRPICQRVLEKPEGTATKNSFFLLR